MQTETESRPPKAAADRKAPNKSALRARMLRPSDEPAPTGTDYTVVGRVHHGTPLERYTSADARNVIAVLRKPAR